MRSGTERLGIFNTRIKISFIKKRRLNEGNDEKS